MTVKMTEAEHVCSHSREVEDDRLKTLQRSPETESDMKLIKRSYLLSAEWLNNSKSMDHRSGIQGRRKNQTGLHSQINSVEITAIHKEAES